MRLLESKHLETLSLYCGSFTLKVGRINGTGFMAEEQKDSNTEAKTTELSAAALGRLMGLATGVEIRMLEGKIDLLTSKLAGMAAKIEKLTQAMSQTPTGADLERIDVQVGSIKAIIRDFVEAAREEKDTQ